jgi:hypothetical protein
LDALALAEVYSDALANPKHGGNATIPHRLEQLYGGTGGGSGIGCGGGKLEYGVDDFGVDGAEAGVGAGVLERIGMVLDATETKLEEAAGSLRGVVEMDPDLAMSAVLNDKLLATARQAKVNFNKDLSAALVKHKVGKARGDAVRAVVRDHQRVFWQGNDERYPNEDCVAKACAYYQVTYSDTVNVTDARAGGTSGWKTAVGKQRPALSFCWTICGDVLNFKKAHALNCQRQGFRSMPAVVVGK